MSQSNETSTAEIYKARKIFLSLMNDRGYDTTVYSNFSANEINIMKNNNQLDMLLTQKEDDVDTHMKHKIYVHHYLSKTLRPQNLLELIEDLFYTEQVLTKQDSLFIIVRENINDTMIGKLRHIWEQEGIFVVIHQISRLQYNIMEHVLVPKYIIINNNEIEQVKKRYNIQNNKQFPDLSRFDPVAQALCIRPGSVCKIIRPSKTAIVSNYYRIVIN